MKTVLVGINSKYIHTSLSVRYLRACCPDMIMREYTINEQAENLAADIYKLGCDAVLFSCYIWNIEFVKDVAGRLSKVSDCKIILGGPEVTYNAKDVLEKCDFADMVIVGEGEVTTAQLYENGMSPIGIDGIVYRSGDEITENPPRELIKDFSTIPFPYTDEEMEQLSGKLIYYESSRGCPFRCSYCLSSTIRSVRFRDLELVKNELMFFIRHKVRIVKFVDRTFNADKKRTYELLSFLIKNASDTTFHFEIAADLITEEMLELLKTAPKGLFQFEIGVQSTNEKTLSAINRYNDIEKIKSAVRRVLELGTVHVHLDLIAGLPYENLESFKKSFDEVFALGADVLQLGFLKMLFGTKIKDSETDFDYKYTDKPPYEVLSNKFISYDDILILKKVENVLEKYHNSGVFKKTIKFLSGKYKSSFQMFLDIANFFERDGYDKKAHSQKGLYEIIAVFYSEKFKDKLFFDYLKFDYFKYNKGAVFPKWSLTTYNKELLKYRFEFLTEENIKKYFPEYDGKPAKEIVKNMDFAEFDYDVTGDGKTEKNIIIFDYLYDRNAKINRRSF